MVACTADAVFKCLYAWRTTPTHRGIRQRLAYGGLNPWHPVSRLLKHFGCAPPELATVLKELALAKRIESDHNLIDSVHHCVRISQAGYQELLEREDARSSRRAKKLLSLQNYDREASAATPQLITSAPVMEFKEDVAEIANDEASVVQTSRPGNAKKPEWDVPGLPNSLRDLASALEKSGQGLDAAALQVALERSPSDILGKTKKRWKAWHDTFILRDGLGVYRLNSGGTHTSAPLIQRSKNSKS